MNRRKFLKRIAAVAAGVMIVPAALKTEDPMWAAFRRARDSTVYSCNGRLIIRGDQYPRQRWVFSRHSMLDGRVFYTKRKIEGAEKC